MAALWAREILPPTWRNGLAISNRRNSVKWNCVKPRTLHRPGKDLNAFGQADLLTEAAPTFARAQTAFAC